jgi:hypothetical protein
MSKFKLDRPLASSGSLLERWAAGGRAFSWRQKADEDQRPCTLGAANPGRREKSYLLDVRQQDKKGVIALQMHQGPPMKVQFRNLQIKVLDEEE